MSARCVRKGGMADLSQIAQQDWNEARQRALFLRPLMDVERCPREGARAAAAELGLSDRQVYRLLQRLRAADGDLTALLPGGSSGGRGKVRLSGAKEQLLRRTIDDLYVTRQQRSAAVLVRDIRRQAQQAGITPPSESTIRRRLQALSVADKRRRGEEHPETAPIYGATPAADGPLDWVQMDHTDVDLILVDPIDRQPIGRPWITVAIILSGWFWQGSVRVAATFQA
jgi:putative transposase